MAHARVAIRFLAAVVWAIPCAQIVAGEPLWAIQPLEQPRADCASIDALINARLAEAGVDPTPPADRRVLIRRLTYDLTGLPPTPREVQAFIGDPHPLA